jgi:hypothetical protein
MRFLVLSLDGDGYAVPIEGLLEITKEALRHLGGPNCEMTTSRN